MFLKTIKLIFAIATIFLFVACGGGHSNSESSSSTSIEKISNHDVISIIYHYSSEICSSSEFKNYMINTLSYYQPKDFITSVESNSVTCATYGKVNNGRECYQEELSNSYNTSCVVAFNSSVSNNSKMSKIMDNYMAKEAIEMASGY
jgi:hypothetical protein